MPAIKKDLRALAREMSPMALRALYRIAQSGESESARVAACNSIIERGYGKAAAVFSDDDSGALQVIVRHIVEGAARADPRTIEHAPRALNGDAPQ